MIAALARAVAARMREKKFPHPVRFGPEILDRKGFELGIVFERDRDAGDPIGAPIGWQKAPGATGQTVADLVYTRRVSGLVTVYVRSSKPGARAEEHEDECDLVCDGVLCAINAETQRRGLPVDIVDSRLVHARETNEDGDRILPGCAAQIRFRVATAVRDITYQGAGPLSGTVAHVALDAVHDADFTDFDPTGA